MKHGRLFQQQNQPLCSVVPRPPPARSPVLCLPVLGVFYSHRLRQGVAETCGGGVSAVKRVRLDYFYPRPQQILRT